MFCAPYCTEKVLEISQLFSGPFISNDILKTEPFLSTIRIFYHKHRQTLPTPDFTSLHYSSPKLFVSWNSPEHNCELTQESPCAQQGPGQPHPAPVRKSPLLPGLAGTIYLPYHSAWSQNHIRLSCTYIHKLTMYNV